MPCVGERRLNMLRAFYTLDGFDRDDDVLPKKLAQPLLGDAPDGAFVTVDF